MLGSVQRNVRQMRLLYRDEGSGANQSLSVRGKAVVNILKANITNADIFGGEARLIDDISRYGSRGILLGEENMCAVLSTNDKSFFKLPGGGIDLGERESDAFMREVLEETGCKCQIIKQLGTISEHNGRSNFCQFSFVFLAKKTGEQGKQSLTKEEKALDFTLRWMTLEDARNTFLNAFSSCTDIKQRFMMKRELTIVEYLIESIKSGEIIL